MLRYWDLETRCVLMKTLLSAALFFFHPIVNLSMLTFPVAWRLDFGWFLGNAIGHPMLGLGSPGLETGLRLFLS